MPVGFSSFVGRFEPGFGFYWDLPEGCIASVDVSNPAEFNSITPQVGARAGQLFCVINGPTDDAFIPLASEDPRTARPEATTIDTWFSLTKFRPAGDTLSDLLWDHLTRGADPAGLDACFPLVPEFDLQLTLWMAGQQLRAERFRLGTHSHSAKLVALVKRNLRAARADSIAKRITDRLGKADQTAHLKIMDWWCDKLSGGKNPTLKAAVFSVIRPADWPIDEAPITHETVVTENFNTANGPTLGPNQTWVQLSGATTVDTNQARITTNPGVNRCDAPVSGDDQYSQVNVTTRSGNHTTTLQWAGANQQRYGYIQNSTQARLIRYTTAGVSTVFATVSQAWPTAPFLIRCEKNGSSFKGILNGSTVVGPTSDSTFNGNRQGGFEGSATAGQWFDDWEFGDLGGATYSESVSLPGAAGFSNAAVISVPVAISLQAASTIADSPANVMPTAVQLAASASIQDLARLITSNALSLAANVGFLATLQVAGGPQTFNESVGLGLMAGLSVSARNQLVNSIAFAANVAMSVTSQKVIGELITVGISADLIPQARAIYQEAISIAVRAAFQQEASTGSLYAPVADAVWRLDPSSNVFRLDPQSPVWRLDHQ